MIKRILTEINGVIREYIEQAAKVGKKTNVQLMPEVTSNEDVSDHDRSGTSELLETQNEPRSPLPIVVPPQATPDFVSSDDSDRRKPHLSSLKPPRAITESGPDVVDKISNISESLLEYDAELDNRNRLKVLEWVTKADFTYEFDLTRIANHPFALQKHEVEEVFTQE